MLKILDIQFIIHSKQKGIESLPQTLIFGPLYFINQML